MLHWPAVLVANRQLSFAMHLGNLGEQIVLKSRKAFECIQFDGSEEADINRLYTPCMKRLSRNLWRRHRQS